MITKTLFNSLFPTKGLNPKKYNLVRRRDELLAAMNKILPLYAIDNYFRICAFWASCGVETDYFKTTAEYASGAAYDTRTDLGNTPQDDGDGEAYKGSGLIQTTGLYNFWRVVIRFVKKKTGKDWSKDEKKYKNFRVYTQSKEYASLLDEADRLGCNFIKHPEMLRNNIEIAVEAACIFWEENDLNSYADRGEFKKLNGVINRGDEDKTPLHWDKRNALYKILLVSVPKNFKFVAPVFASNAGENSAMVVLTPTENDSPEAHAVPPVPTASEPGEDQNASATGESKLDKTKIKEFGEKFLMHCPKDKISNILLVVGTRIFSTITSVWFAGLHGKILLIVAGAAAVFFIGRAIQIYSPRIAQWAKKAFNFFFGD